jgi:hypothetical protein
MKIFFYLFYFAMLFSVYWTNLITTLKISFKNSKNLQILEMLGKVVWGIGVSISGAFISNVLSYMVFLIPGFWLGISFIIFGVFIEVKTIRALEILKTIKEK